MLKLALGMVTVALLLSGCTAIQNTVGGGGATTPPDTTTPPVPNIPPATGKYEDQAYDYNGVRTVLKSCGRDSTDTNVVICNLTLRNPLSDKQIYIYGDYSHLIFEDGRQINVLGAKLVLPDEKWYSDRFYFTAREDVTYFVQLKFSVPREFKSIKYFDFNAYPSYRFKNISID